MREVDLITTETKKMGVTEDRRHITMHRMQPIRNYGPAEAVVPIDHTVAYEEYEIQKINIDGNERYVALDSGADGIIGDLVRSNHSLRCYWELAERHNTTLTLQLDAECKHSKKAWETYNENISYLRKASFLVRLKFLLTGRMH